MWKDRRRRIQNVLHYDNGAHFAPIVEPGEVSHSFCLPLLLLFISPLGTQPLVQLNDAVYSVMLLRVFIKTEMLILYTLLSGSLIMNLCSFACYAAAAAYVITLHVAISLYSRLHKICLVFL